MRIYSSAIGLGLQLALNGLAFGGLVFLLAAGLSVIFGLMDVLNLAHGSFYMLGAYTGVVVLGAVGNFWLALLVAPLLLALLGATMEVVFFRRLYRRGHLMQVLLTFGFTLVFVDLVRWRFGPQNQPFPVPAELRGTIPILDFTFPIYRVFVIVAAGVIAALLMLGWRRLRVGAILRAGVADTEMVGLLGIDLARVFTLTFAFGAGLAGLAGVVAGPYLATYPGMDENVLILALAVVVLGGLGSIEGALVGSLLIGLATTFGAFFRQEVAIAVVFAVMAVVLLVRPRGLFGLRT
ncbi:MAG TPA: branched-chain amino acid ABC transporter permease [Methylomirabilota bacterium]|nr:branched-chain amino acid ABC transporter permease [Methylomirabilota bacterium]